MASSITRVRPHTSAGPAGGGRGLRRTSSASARRGARRGGSRGPSLEEVLISSWARLCTEGTAECPVCHESSLSVAGCPDCGSALS